MGQESSKRKARPPGLSRSSKARPEEVVPLPVSPIDSDVRPFDQQRTPWLCNRCKKLASILSDPSAAQEDRSKEDTFDMNSNNNLISLLLCSRVCPLYVLVMNTLIDVDPILLTLCETMDDVSPPGGLAETLYEWSKYLNGSERPSTGPSSVLEDEYNNRIARLGLPGTVPPFKETMRVLMDWRKQRIHIREQYASKGQILEISLSLLAHERGGLKVLSSRSLRVSSHPD
ncbi:hypothetical protein EG329_002666 [Mollisiaceae sp. DMI_Dod_QoI]|nr:hypothetical protein EG329_002666 [Helotiales sp. DMI_Dod_QoI]